ncbi:uncharacterized protein UTRI_03386 [Ustilago trichophora]|uniref:Uncharacterized protein n=1 Tax=Ustilago trichophora TaxID=86804 RepID=A0A5C3E0V5_9BASI|nr:uncharacterized protein UTRI_03386 [Ustilago trichophora]
MSRLQKQEQVLQNQSQTRDWDHKRFSFCYNFILKKEHFFLQGHLWLAQKPRVQHQLPDYSTLNNLRLAPHQEFFNAPRQESANITEEVLEEAALPDSYEIEHVARVSSCMLCAGPKDSAAYGYVKCKQAKQMWKSIMPMLQKLINRAGVPINMRNVVLGWPAIKYGLQNNYSPKLELDGFASEHVTLVASTINEAYQRCTASKPPAFVKRWVDRSAFMQEVNGELKFQQMSNNAATTPAETQPQNPTPSSAS